MCFIFLSVYFFRDNSRCEIYFVGYSRHAHEMQTVHYRFLILTKIVILRKILVTISTIIYYENTFWGLLILQTGKTKMLAHLFATFLHERDETG